MRPGSLNGPEFWFAVPVPCPAPSLRYVNRDFMTSTSPRERFGIKEENKAQASRFIKEALDAGKILPYDENAAPKLMKYIPHWARSPVVDK